MWELWHETFWLSEEAGILVSNMSWQTVVNEAKDIYQDQLLKRSPESCSSSSKTLLFCTLWCFPSSSDSLLPDYCTLCRSLQRCILGDTGDQEDQLNAFSCPGCCSPHSVRYCWVPWFICGLGWILRRNTWHKTRLLAYTSVYSFPFLSPLK